MSEDSKELTVEDFLKAREALDSMPVPERRVFFVSLTFDNPMECSVQVAARDEAHAREIVQEQFKDRKGLRIVDVFDMIELEKAQQGMEKLQRDKQTPKSSLILPDAVDADFKVIN